jgi:signal transduction histidine kinase
VEASPSFEWVWLYTRLAVALALIPAALIAYKGLSGAEGILVLAGLGIAYSGGLALLLKAGRPVLTFKIGFICDNILVVLAWWWTVSRDDPTRSVNDLWLSLLPVIIIGVVRVGPRLGLVYVGLWLAVYALFTLQYQPEGAYPREQLPVRLIFLGLTGVLIVWLVSWLNRERNAARGLQSEAEKFAEIARILGASLDPAKAFLEVAPTVKRLIPYDRLGLVEVNMEAGTYQMLTSAGDDIQGMPERVSFPIPRTGTAHETLARLEARLLDQRGAERMFEAFSGELTPFASETRSLLIAPIFTGDRAIGVVFARSTVTNAFTSTHLERLIRVASHISGAMANAQVYAQAIQLGTEREARLKLDQQNRQLQRDNDARNMFLSSVSHELRTPLTSMVAFNDLLLKNKSGNLTDRDTRFLKIMRSNSEHLTSLVNELLDISHVESGKVLLKPSSFDVAEMLKEIARSVEPLLKPRRQRLALSGGSREATVTADKQRFVQILSNFVSNSSKYSDEGTEVRVHWQLEDGKLQVAVSDSGCGISESDMPMLFEPFFRSAKHVADKVPGTGLGLVISKGLIEAHGGEVEIESAEGEGTTVRFWIPADGAKILRDLNPGEAA